MTETTVAPFKATRTFKHGLQHLVIEAEWNGTRLSITGTEYVHGAHRLDGVVGCGQILDTVRRAGHTRLAAIWDAWHLNDMRPGCEHQRAAGWSERRIDTSKPSDTYGLHYPGQGQATWNLLGWIRPDEHPDGLLTRPCPECGYRYGTAWKTEAVPEDILIELASIVGATIEVPS